MVEQLANMNSCFLDRGHVHTFILYIKCSEGRSGWIHIVSGCHCLLWDSMVALSYDPHRDTALKQT